MYINNLKMKTVITRFIIVQFSLEFAKEDFYFETLSVVIMVLSVNFLF
jgi:uncharacterized protein (DUF486 family)